MLDPCLGQLALVVEVDLMSVEEIERIQLARLELGRQPARAIECPKSSARSGVGFWRSV